MEVNEEVAVLEDFLKACVKVLKPGGRLVIISYHSIEDRLVKNLMKTGNVAGEMEKDFYGNIYRPFKLVSKKAIIPDDAEIRENPRARSAKMRIGERKAD
jgi:16S rRNA (cytosine1402-N4)-methyltransferase